MFQKNITSPFLWGLLNLEGHFKLSVRMQVLIPTFYVFITHQANHRYLLGEKRKAQMMAPKMIEIFCPESFRTECSRNLTQVQVWSYGLHQRMVHVSDGPWMDCSSTAASSQLLAGCQRLNTSLVTRSQQLNMTRNSRG